VIVDPLVWIPFTEFVWGGGRLDFGVLHDGGPECRTLRPDRIARSYAAAAAGSEGYQPCAVLTSCKVGTRVVSRYELFDDVLVSNGACQPCPHKTRCYGR